MTECNTDGAITDGSESPVYGGCDTSSPVLHLITSSGTGTFSTTFTLVTGAVGSSTSPPADCPQALDQAEHEVQCVLGSAPLVGASGTNSAFAPIYFAPATFQTKTTKAKTAGKYDLTITQPAGYQPTKTAALNTGGYGFTGELSTGSTKCQGTTSSTGVTWPIPGYPACTKNVGETVEILFKGKKIGTATISVSKSDFGGFTTTIKNLSKGTGTLELLGETSGTVVERTSFKIG